MLVKIIKFVIILPIFLGVTFAQKINLNTADTKMLTNIISGIGVKKAEAIVKYRQTHGPFRSLDELSMVQGLSKKFIKKNFTQLEELLLID